MTNSSPWPGLFRKLLDGLFFLAVGYVVGIQHAGKPDQTPAIDRLNEQMMAHQREMLKVMERLEQTTRELQHLKNSGGLSATPGTSPASPARAE
ncbi:MAG TPA: hypothetical protein VGE29_10570 [Prosthecobacter sp.]